MRVEKGLSLRAIASRMGAGSSEAWARYERGRVSPTVEKLEELLQAVDPNARFVLRRVVTPHAGL
jgi:transcriptional regulator with XRE-family HTH domain